MSFSTGLLALELDADRVLNSQESSYGLVEGGSDWRLTIQMATRVKWPHATVEVAPFSMLRDGWAAGKGPEAKKRG